MKKRKDGRYQLKVVFPDKTYKYVYGKTQKEVNEKKISLLKGYSENADGSILLKDFIPLWWETRVDVKRSTMCVNQSYLKHITEHLGQYPLNKIKLMDCQRFFNRLSDEGLTQGSMNQIKSILSMILKYAVQNDIISGNPCQYVKLSGKAPEDKTALTKEQQDRLIEFVKGHKHERIILLCLLCGLRIGEAVAVQRSDIDTVKRTVTVNKAYSTYLKAVSTPKTKAGYRTIPIPNRLYERLNLEDEFNTASPNTIRKYARGLSDKVGFKFTPHTLRHTYATNLDIAGVPPKACQYLLGHANIDITKNRYTHLSAEHLAAATCILTHF